jgi:hypothetical protein
MSVADYTGINEIIEAFERQAKKPYFSMWFGKAPALQNDINDFDVAKEALKNKINDLLRAGKSAVFTIHLHNAQPKRENGAYLYADTTYTMLYCQAVKEQKQAINGTDPGLYPIYNIIEKQNELITALTSKVNAIEAEESEPESVGSDETVMLDKLGSIVNSPLGLLAATYLPRLLDRIMPEKQKISAIAGDEATDLEATINILFSKGVTLEHLQKLAAMPEAKIKMLLTML